MIQQIPAFLKGQLLLAMPGLVDPNFSQTVTCLYEHSEQGAVGGIVNRVHPFLSAKSIFEELKIDCTPTAETIPVYMGGPVHMGEIFVLHGPPFGWQGCLRVMPDLGMSNTLDILKSIAAGKGPDTFIIMLGCAGWGPGQLELEIKENTWLTCPFSDGIVFNLPFESRWRAAMKRIGVDPARISGKAGNA
jgi:putative transcriptional regulator